MQWILDNWFLILLVGGMLAMHLFGHGHGHGKGDKKGHGEHDKSSDTKHGAAPSGGDRKTDNTVSRRDPKA